MISWTLFAAKIGFEGWMKLIMAAVVFIVYIINYLIKESKQSRKRPPAQPQRKPTSTPQRPGEPQRSAAQGKAPDEIEEFLRRAAQQRKEASRPQEPTRVQSTSRRTAPPRDSRVKQAQRVSEPQAPVRRLIDRPADVETDVVNPSQRAESLAEQVASRLSTNEFSARTARLTEDLSRADIEREQHLKKMFGHQVGKLPSEKLAASDEKTTSTAPSVVGPASGGLGGLLYGDTLRYAVILNEILGRPEDRWPDDRW